MVGDNSERDVVLLIVVILNARNVDDMLHNILNGIDLKEVINALHYAGKALKTHTGVDIAALEAGIVIVSVIVELSENEVPELNISVAVAADSAGRRAAAVLLAAVEIELRAGAAGTCAVFPEVILFTETNHMVRRNAELLRPDVVRLVVLLIDADIYLIRGHLEHLGAELPCPRGCLTLEVIAEREIPEHLKESAVARGDSDALDVGRSDALLAGGDALSRRGQLAREVFLERRHAGVDEQQALIPLRHERKARQAEMTLALEKAQILLSEFIESRPFHNNNSLKNKNRCRSARDGRSRGTTRIAQNCTPLLPLTQATPVQRGRLRAGCRTS